MSDSEPIFLSETVSAWLSSASMALTQREENDMLQTEEERNEILWLAANWHHRWASGEP